MGLRTKIVLSLLSTGLLWAAPSEKEAELSARLFAQANALWLKGSPGEALAKYRSVVKHYAASKEAPAAQYAVARLYEMNNEHLAAFQAYQVLLNQFKNAGYSAKAVDHQLAIANRVLETLQADRKKPTSTLPKNFPTPTEIATMFQQLVKNAGQSEQAPTVRYRFAVALEQLGFPRDAREAHEKLVELFPRHHLADDASFQAAYIEAKRSRKQPHATGKSGARMMALLSLRFFLREFPNSEKAPQANLLIAELESEEIEALASAARFYHKQGKSAAAAVYWKEILAQPQSALDRVPEIHAEAKMRLEAAAETKPPIPSNN